MNIKTIHFEDVWLSAEKACEFTKTSQQESIEAITKFTSLIQDNPDFYLGQILIHLSNLSRHYQVNTWDALQKATTDMLVDYYEP